MSNVNRIKRDALKYLSPLWEFLKENKKIESIEKTIQLFRDLVLRDGATVDFYGEKIKFQKFSMDDLKVSVVMNQNLPKDVVGRYNVDTNAIEINPTKLNKIKSLYEMIAHEFTHKIQNALVSNIDKYDVLTKQRVCIEMLKMQNDPKENEFNVFGIQFTGRVYIETPYAKNIETTNEIYKSIYSLSITERNAFATAGRFGNLLVSVDKFQRAHNNEVRYPELKMYLSSQEQLEDALCAFRKQYRVESMSDRDIFNLVDTAHYNILHNHVPDTDIEALITYDLALALAYQNDSLNKDEFCNLLNLSSKRKRLSEYGYAIPWENTRYGKHVMLNNVSWTSILSIDDVVALNDAERYDNPDVMLRAVARWGNDVVDLINNFDALKEYLYATFEQYPKWFVEDVASILGNEYSLDHCKAIRKERESMLLNHHNEDVAQHEADRQLELF